jgi:hypothetical protein
MNGFLFIPALLPLKDGNIRLDILDNTYEDGLKI